MPTPGIAGCDSTSRYAWSGHVPGCLFHAIVINMILGVDEVGRGCLAGPVAAGAVLLDKKIRGVRDSKKLTRLQREKLDVRIRTRAVAFGIGWASVEEVDSLGLTEAVRLAMQRAVAQISAELEYDELIIDGNYNFLKENPKSRPVIKADDSVCAVGAASIIAKVARDAYMREAAITYPGYFFERHVGYATPKHRAMLVEQGICELHRLSFAQVKAAISLAEA
jgi:ribonuclease HII